MRENLQDLVDRVSAADWERYLPAPSTVRGRPRRVTAHRPLAIAGAAALVAAAVVVPAAIANRVGSAERPRPAAATGIACVSPGAATPLLLTPADAVPGYDLVQTRTHPDPVDALIFGPEKVPGIKEGQLGAAFSSLGTRGISPEWQISHQALRYSPGAGEAGYAAVETGTRATGGTVVLSRGGAEPLLIVKVPVEEDGGPQEPPAPVLPPLWAVTTRTGDCVSVIEARTMNMNEGEVPSDGPGLTYLQTLAAAARAKAAGQSVPKLPLPPTKVYPAPDGYLKPEDLGPGIWRVDRNEGYYSAAGTFKLPTYEGCKVGATATLTRPARQTIYHGAMTTKDQQDWEVEQLVLRTSVEDAIKVMAAERANEDSACWQTSVVASPSGVGDEMFIADVSRGGEAEAWVRVGGTVIWLRFRASSRTSLEAPSVTGVNDYLITIARKAVSRAQEG